MDWFGSWESSEIQNDLGRQCCDLLAVRCSLGWLIGNHDLVTILQGTTAWDLLHRASAPSASPCTGAGGRRAVGWLQGTRQPKLLGYSCPLMWPVCLLQHHFRGEETLGVGQSMTWILTNKGRG